MPRLMQWKALWTTITSSSWTGWKRRGLFQPLQTLLRHCQEEEIHHRDEAREAGEGRAYGLLLGAWAWVVGAGSKAAVVAAKRI